MPNPIEHLGPLCPEVVAMSSAVTRSGRADDIATEARRFFPTRGRRASRNRGALPRIAGTERIGVVTTFLPNCAGPGLTPGAGDFLRSSIRLVSRSRLRDELD